MTDDIETTNNEVDAEEEGSLANAMASIANLMEKIAPVQGWQMKNPNNFGTAIANLYLGNRVTRSGWNGKGQYLELQVPDEHSKMTLPYIYITTVQGDRVPWLASQTDMLATDWWLA